MLRGHRTVFRWPIGTRWWILRLAAGEAYAARLFVTVSTAR